MTTKTTPYKSGEHLKTDEEKKAYFEEAIADAIERLEELKERYHDDAEAAHCKADAILLELLHQLGAGEVALMYNKVDEFLGFEYGST